MLNEILFQEMQDINEEDIDTAVEIHETLAAGCGALNNCGGCISNG